MGEIGIVERDMTLPELERMNAGFDENSVENGIEIQGSERIGFVALDGERFIGCSSGLAYKNGTEYSGWFYLTDLFVEKEYRLRGIGSQLLRALEGKLLEFGISRIWTWTAGYEGPEFYKKQGYRVFAEMENRYSSGDSRIGMIKDMTWAASNCTAGRRSTSLDGDGKGARCALCGERAGDCRKGVLMTRYIAAYDTEEPGECLAACRKIRQVHERFDFPATFFIQGTLLEADGPAFRALLGDVPQFEIASHTYSHRMLRDHSSCGPAVEPEACLREIQQGKMLVEQTFGRPCVGMRPGCGFDRGLRGAPWLVRAVADAGFGYISSLLWGPETTMPALLEPPFTYSAEGRPDLWEMPGHGWHENLLKGDNLIGRPQRVLAWPSPFPEAIRLAPVTTPEVEYAMNRIFVDRAVDLGLPYVSLVWHPWSLARFDPAMTMLDMTFAYVRERGLTPTTFVDEWRRLASV